MKEAPHAVVLEAFAIPSTAVMPMGTISHRADGSSDSTAPRRQSFTAYTNADSAQRWAASQQPDDRNVDTNGSRPGSQGMQSNTTGTSRPSTGNALADSMTSPAVQPRPGSSGVDIAPPPAMRHRFAEAYSSEEYLTMLEQVFASPTILTTGVLHVLYVRSTRELCDTDKYIFFRHRRLATS